MTKKVILLKPFVFSSAAEPEQRLTKEIKFFPDKDANGAWIPTEKEIDDVVAEHEWIAVHYADGAIERPEATEKRAQDATAKLEKIKNDNAEQLAKAEQAMNRSRASTKNVDMNNADVQKDLNTPINELKGNRGKSIDKPGKAAAS